MLPTKQRFSSSLFLGGIRSLLVEAHKKSTFLHFRGLLWMRNWFIHDLGDDFGHLIWCCMLGGDQMVGPWVNRFLLLASLMKLSMECPCCHRTVSTKVCLCCAGQDVNIAHANFVDGWAILAVLFLANPTPHYAWGVWRPALQQRGLVTMMSSGGHYLFQELFWTTWEDRDMDINNVRPWKTNHQ